MQAGVMSRAAPAPYYLFLRDELIPEVARRVRIDAGQKTLWSYSLSGSFVTWLNYFDHSLFRNYILASPNWGEFGIQQRLVEGAVFRAPQQVTQKLFVSFDAEKEMPSPELVGQLRTFFDAGLPGYKVGYVFTHGETHTTSWFSTMPAALRFIYGPDGG
jgi:predicted alpha/beta superfamily hydrolase